MQWLFKVAWCKHPVKCCNAAYHMVCKPQIQSMADRMLLQPGFAKPCAPYTLNLAWVRPTTNRGRENWGENMQSPYMWVSSFSPVVSRQHAQMLLSCAESLCWPPAVESIHARQLGACIPRKTHMFSIPANNTKRMTESLLRHYTAWFRHYG